MGVTEFPWTHVGVGVFLGLIAAITLQRVLFRDTPAGIHIHCGVALVGALIGGFLGVCYHVLAGWCGLELSA